MSERYGDKPRSIRVDDELWGAMTAAAASKGETISEALRRSMRAYVKRAAISRRASQ